MQREELVNWRAAHGLMSAQGVCETMESKTEGLQVNELAPVVLHDGNVLR